MSDEKGSRPPIAAWVEERFGLSAVKALGQHKLVPRHRHSVWYYLGGMTLFLFLLQVATGILLTLYYRPSPDEAFESVRFITGEVPFGWLIRGLHHWAASALVVLAIAHLIRVILHGAYKYPREFTWFSGVALLLLVFAFGLTGSLLPWDQRAYWATQVRIEIFATIPVVGDFVARLIQGGEELSGLTLSRFYAAHVWLFPLMLFALIAAHLRLVVVQGDQQAVGPAIEKRCQMGRIGGAHRGRQCNQRGPVVDACDISRGIPGQ